MITLFILAGTMGGSPTAENRPAPWIVAALTLFGFSSLGWSMVDAISWFKRKRVPP
jgi:hypothetical protein